MPKTPDTTSRVKRTTLTFMSRTLNGGEMRRLVVLTDSWPRIIELAADADGNAVLRLDDDRHILITSYEDMAPRIRSALSDLRCQ